MLPLLPIDIIAYVFEYISDLKDIKAALLASKGLNEHIKAILRRPMVFHRLTTGLDHGQIIYGSFTIFGQSGLILPHNYDISSIFEPRWGDMRIEIVRLFIEKNSHGSAMELICRAIYAYRIDDVFVYKFIVILEVLNGLDDSYVPLFFEIMRKVHWISQLGDLLQLYMVKVAIKAPLVFNRLRTNKMIISLFDRVLPCLPDLVTNIFSRWMSMNKFVLHRIIKLVDNYDSIIIEKYVQGMLPRNDFIEILVESRAINALSSKIVRRAAPIGLKWKIIEMEEEHLGH
jgi:hypothetical protein